MSVDLHQLANTPGFGAAKAAIKKAGLWDEHAGQQEREFRVNVSYTAWVTEVVTVKARSDEEAERLASQAVEEKTDGFFQIELAEVLE